MIKQRQQQQQQITRAIAVSLIVAIAACLLSTIHLDNNNNIVNNNNIHSGHRSSSFLVDGFVVKTTPSSRTRKAFESSSSSIVSPAAAAKSTALSATPAATANGPPAPVLNGKRILPVKIMLAGLKGHTVAAAYAVLSPLYKTTDGDWQACTHVGISTDLGATLASHLEEHGKEKVAHIRALSFMIPNENAMESIASDWRKLALEEKGLTNFDPVLAAMDMDDFLDDDEDDDFDDDDDDEYFEMMAGAMASRSSPVDSAAATILEGALTPNAAVAAAGDADAATKEEAVVSPFDDPQAYATTTEDGETLEFNKENVDKVLDEIRPYLISDGGNVSVDSIDTKTKSVYLVLEGACGSCPSSTITMQMGIERVLKENFAGLGEVKQVDPDADDSPKELTYLTVEKEVNRIKPAIIAMGGLVTILEVDPIGTVKLRFRGANKVRSGLEMALLDIDFVKHVEFVME